jgi:aspartate/methionine/tyrosine aminotransferase
MRLSPSKRSAAMQPSPVRVLFDKRKATSINLGLGEPSMPVPMEVLERGYQRYREARPGYSLNAGHPELRERLFEYHPCPHIASPRNIIVTVGATGGLFATLLCVGDPGDEILVGDPSFFLYRRIIEMLGMRAIPVPSNADNGFSLDPERVVHAITPRTRGIILNSPNNPTGNIDSQASLRALVDVTDRSGIWLISDEIYREHYYGDSPPASVGDLSDRAIVIGALSKSWSMTGFRIGYVLAPDPLVTPIAQAHQYNVTCAPTISQFVAIAALQNREWLVRSRAQFAAQRDAMFSALALPPFQLAFPATPASGGFFTMLDTRSLRMGSFELADLLLSEGDVVTVPGAAFGDNAEGFLRLSFCETPANVTEGVRRIGRVFERLTKES